MNEGKKKDKLFIEVLKVLNRELRPLKTREILKELLTKGELQKRERKTLTRTLNRLESLGLTKSYGGRGREGKSWTITKEGIQVLKPVNLKGSIGFLVFLSLLPKEYRELPLLLPIEKIAKSVVLNLSPDKLKEVEERFFYQKPYTMRFYPIKERDFETIVDAIVRRKPIEVKRKELPLDRRPFLFKVILSKLGGRELKIKGALVFSTQVGKPKVVNYSSLK
ncbi:hypothetical protein [Thermovibrio sp.]